MNTPKKAVLIAAIVTNFFPIVALGVSSDDMISANDNTVFYDPGYSCDSTATVTPTGQDAEETAFLYFVSQLGLTADASAGIVGNFMQESSLSPIAQNPTSGAYGIAQWLGTRLTDLENYTQNEPGGVKSFNNQLAFSKHELQTDYASVTAELKNPAQANNVVNATTRFEIDYEGAGSGANMPQRISNAQQVLAKYGKDVPQGGAPQGGSCTTTPGNGSSVVQQALSVTWPSPACPQTYQGQGRANCNSYGDTPTQGYQKIYDHAGGGYTDCGAFVGSVMRASKEDPSYPAADTVADYDYVTSHKSTYDIIYHPTSTSQLQPGDILIYGGNPPDGHTELYTGKQPGGYVVADASLGTHSPQLNTVGDAIWIMQQPGVVAARHK